MNSKTTIKDKTSFTSHPQCLVVAFQGQGKLLQECGLPQLSEVVAMVLFKKIRKWATYLTKEQSVLSGTSALDLNQNNTARNIKPG